MGEAENNRQIVFCNIVVQDVGMMPGAFAFKVDKVRILCHVCDQKKM